MIIKSYSHIALKKEIKNKLIGLKTMSGIYPKLEDYKYGYKQAISDSLKCILEVYSFTQKPKKKTTRKNKNRVEVKGSRKRYFGVEF